MTRSDFMKNLKLLLALSGLLFWSGLARAELATSDDCRPLEPAAAQPQVTLDYANALLWEISKEGQEPSYIFGTIHVADPEVTTLPEPISAKLQDAGVFVMEALPEPEEAMKLSQMMFYNDGTTLRDLVDEALFTQTADILALYQFPAEAVPFMKPWAAFLIMNYPAEDGLPLDLQLLNTAQRNGAELKGLETLTEQGEIFSGMDIDTQLRLMLDTVCNYETMSDDVEMMKSFYLKRDLQGLVTQSNKYSVSQEKIYQDLMKRLLTDRNTIMVERMQSILETGDAFIAIGAMHLPGDDGVLALLANRGYQITSIY